MTTRARSRKQAYQGEKRPAKEKRTGFAESVLLPSRIADGGPGECNLYEQVTPRRGQRK
jgi:hypothetical protein